MPARYFRFYLYGLLLLGLGSCIEPYQPDVIQVAHNYLVVDGFINSKGTTTVRLSRAVPPAGANIPPGEKNARIQIEEEGGPQYPLTEAADGNYKSQPLQLNPTRRYRLRIRTAAGQEYVSAFEQNKITPPIDSVSWEVQPDGLQIYVNTHDPKQNTRFYRWKYEETWEYTTPYYSILEYKDAQIQDRRENINLCYRGGSSAGITIGATTQLSQDVVSEYPLVKLPDNSLKIKHKYSILVKQYAQSKEAYSYAEALKKNTENIGTLFDPLPSQLTGNIQCLSNPGEPVIGYVNVTSEEVKRIFIRRPQLPTTWRPLDEYTFCTLDTILLSEVATTFPVGSVIPVTEAYGEMGLLIGYTASAVDCVDCRVRGTNVKPAFWE